MRLNTRFIVLLASALGLALLFHALRLPGAWLFGSLAASAIFAVRGWCAIQFPNSVYFAGQAIIGTALGAGFSPKTLEVIPEHAGIFLFAVVFILLTSLLNGWLLSRFTALDPATSFLGTMPGGASAMAAMSDSLRADTRLVAAVQYVRLLIILASLACVAPILKAHAHGAAGSGAMIFYGSQFVSWKFGLLLLLAVVGWLAGTRTRIPAGAFLVPTVLYFLLGLRDIHPDGWPWPILATAYAVMGLQIGGRFHPRTIVMIRRVILPVVGTTLLLLVGSVVLAFFVSRLMHLDFISAYLAATPGGLDSVAAVATDLHVDTTIVVSMHLVRLLCVLLFGPWLVRLCTRGWLPLKPFGKPSGRSLLNQCRLMTVKLSSHHWTRSEKPVLWKLSRAKLSKMNSVLSDAAFWNRLQFGFTLVYHYLFPQLTMGLAWFLVYWKWKAYRTGEEKYNQAARFWVKIFGVNFAVGVVTGIPMEFQFGTNWADFSRYAGGVIGQTLAMEGMFAFFLESAFVGALIWGEKRLGPRNHFLAAVAVALGSWTSGYFILVTNAFMQHPVGYGIAPDGSLSIASLGTYLLNPWGLIQFAHNQTAAVVTGAFVVAAVGALYSLRGVHPTQARLYLGAGTFVGLIASVVVAFPTGDQQARMVGDHQPVTLAAMEGKFVGGPMAGVSVIGQPNIEERRLDNPIEIPGALSFLAYGTFQSYVHGLGEYPQDTWPDNVALLYYSFHLMITLGTIFIVITAYANFERWRGRLELNRWLLWVLMLAFPFPYIANTLGWMTAELGRQPWLVYGLFRTQEGYSKVVSSGDTIFTLIGFTGLYFVLGLLFLYLVGREIGHGPAEEIAINEGKAPAL